MNFFPFVTFHDNGEPFAVRIKDIIRFERREILTIDRRDNRILSEIVDESFEEIEAKIREACNFFTVDADSEIFGE